MQVKILTSTIRKVNIINQYTARFTAIITNQGLTKDYYLREIGLFAQDPDDGEILYMIGIDEKPDVIPADGYQMLISQEFNIDVVISNVENITVNGKYANLITTEDLNTHNTATDAHANLFKKVLLTEAKTIANTADWNTLTESRTYKISGVTFAADKHQPVGAVGTGELVVLKNGDDTIAQVYYANSAAYDKAGAYHRMCIGGAWTDWVYNITNKGGVVTGDFNINGKLTVKYARQMILFCSILVLNAATDIELIANAILTAPKISKACSISGDSFKILGQDTCYLAQANVPITTINPEAETEDDWNYWIGTEQAVYFNISQSRSSITGLNEAKVTSDCHVLYSNIIT